jgi:hypothetical protein
MSSRDPGLAWTLVAKPELMGCLAPLLRIRSAQGPVRIVATPVEALNGASEVLVVGGAPIESAMLPDDQGRAVPVGWISGRVDTVVRYVEAVACRQRFELGGSLGPVALLAQWQDRALELADRLEQSSPALTVRWSAERLGRRDLLPALWNGLGAALYVGHGEPWGWMGYGGVTAQHWLGCSGDPLGALYSLSEKTGRPGAETCFCDALVDGGAAAAVLGCVGPNRHAENRRLALALAGRLEQAHTLAESLQGIPPEWLMGYRISGDPAAELSGTAGAWGRVKRVLAPHAEAEPDHANLGAAVLAARVRVRPGRCSMPNHRT